MLSNLQKKDSLTSQSAWILIAKIAGFALNTMLPLLVVRYLTQENVGVYRQAFLLASNAVLVLPLGVTMSAYYFLNREPEKHPAAVFNILLFNFVMGALAFLVLLLFPQVLGATFQTPELSRLAPLIGILIWLWMFSSFLETAALSLQEARLGAAIILLSQLLKTALMTAAVVAFQNVDSLLYATIVLFAAQAVAMIAYLNHKFPSFWRRFDPGFMRRQLAYSLPFGFSVLLYVAQTDIHNYFVSHSFSAAEFAIYSVGCFQLPLIAMLYDSVGSVMIPRMSQLQDEDKKREMLELSAKATQKLAFFYLPLFVFLMVVANEFITTLFTRDYEASAAIFRVNLFALPLFSLVVDPVMRAYPVAGRFLLKVRIVICAVLFGVFWLGLGTLSMLQMITIVVAAILFEKLVCAWLSVRMLEARSGDIMLLRVTGKIAIAAAAAGGALLGFYLIAGDRLQAACMALSSNILSAAGLSRIAEFVGGSLFLGACLILYATCYLFAAAWLRVFDLDGDRRVVRLLRRVLPPGTAETKAV